MIKIEKMNASHVAGVARLEAECFSMPWSEKSIASELENDLALWLVATEEDQVVGYVGSQSVLGEADMMNIAVAQNKRRMGIAEKLVDRLIEMLAKNEVHSLALEVRKSNTAACNLYEKKGFLFVGCRPRYYEKPVEDALILRKEWCN